MDIGPGDWVECVQNRQPDTLPPLGLVVGQVYMVEAVGVTSPEDIYPNVPWLRISGVHLRQGKCGIRAEWFRPVYRPKADLIEQLSRPIVRQPEKVDA